MYSLNGDGPGVLYVGGTFTDAGGDPAADYIATWSGTTWKALGPALTGPVEAIAYRSGKVYVGGTFTNAGGQRRRRFLAVWDGTRWGPACNASGAAINGNVLALQIVGSTLYVGGTFQNGAGIASAILFACDLGTGAARSTVDTDGAMSGPVYALAADSKGGLYAGGGFGNLTVRAAGGLAPPSARWWRRASGRSPRRGSNLR